MGLFTGLILCLCGCGKGQKGTATPSDAWEEDKGNGSDENESIASSETTTEDMTLLRDYDSCSNQKYSWYIVRNNDHLTSGCDGSIAIEQYDAYYADLDVNNTGNTENSENKVMYLTFDCGYENGYTEQILDVLAAHGAKACFFVTQTYIRDNPELVIRMKEEGHQVGNHTVTHPSMPDISIEKQKEELNTCAEYMKETTGYDMDLYFRPPAGEYSERVLQLAEDMGYKTIFWSMVYMDYDVNNQPGTEYVIDHFNKYHHNGAIILMHAVSESNANALDTVLTNMEKEGYSFPSLDEMFEK